MKNTSHDTRLKTGNTHPPTPEPAKDPNETHRVQPGSEAHRENQQELGVDAEHRTDDMKQGHRGTFP